MGGHASSHLFFGTGLGTKYRYRDVADPLASLMAGAFNSAMTLLQNKQKLKTDYIMLFFFSAILYYCLATFEGPLLAIRWFNMIAHNSEWVIGHVHSGALGW